MKNFNLFLLLLIYWIKFFTIGKILPDYILNSTAFINTGKDSTGTGFILYDAEKMYLVTAKQVLMNKIKFISDEIYVIEYNQGNYSYQASIY